MSEINLKLKPKEVNLKMNTKSKKKVAFNFKEKENINLKLDSKYVVVAGERDYDKLINHPSINNEELIGNKTGEQLHLQNKMDEITAQEIDKIVFGG